MHNVIKLYTQYSGIKSYMKEAMRIMGINKSLAVFLAVTLTIAVFLSGTLGADRVYAAEDKGGWHLVDTKYIPSPMDIKILGSSFNRGGGLYDTKKGEGNEGNMTLSHSRTTANGGGVAHINYQVLWDTPPAYLASGVKTGFKIEMKVLDYSASWSSIYKVSAHFDSGELESADYATSSPIRFQSDAGETHILNKNTYFESSKVIPEGKAGDKKAIWLNLGGNYGYCYLYEWKEASADSNAEAFESGSRLMWQPAAGLGYRLFRSTSKSSLGISVTDFYLTGTSYADVNVEANTTYYYTVKPVLAEAKPFDGIDEKLGDAIATFTVTTGSDIYKPGSYKHFIMLKLDNPNMSVDGISQEVDPGRGTSPLTISGRTMVPIRAVVEAMGGTVGWDSATQKITLTARGNVVEMWMGKTDIKINGVSRKMDVAPVSKNSRTFVPVRFAAENLNCKVDWINSTKEAVIVFEE